MQPWPQREPSLSVGTHPDPMLEEEQWLSQEELRAKRELGPFQAKGHLLHHHLRLLVHRFQLRPARGKRCIWSLALSPHQQPSSVKPHPRQSLRTRDRVPKIQATPIPPDTQRLPGPWGPPGNIQFFPSTPNTPPNLQRGAEQALTASPTA